MSFKKILWATDFSPHARDAGRQAFACASCRGGVVHVLTVEDPAEAVPVLLEVGDPLVTEHRVEALEQGLDRQHETDLRARLEREVALVRQAGVPVELHVRVGRPWEEIIGAAQEFGSDVIVVGSHGRRSVEEILLGSTVERVTKHATCPVLVVR
jgi:nucleotide-binding universal stress UspA family protein